MTTTHSAICPVCKNDSWETHPVWGYEGRYTATCTNCHYERPYHKRKPSKELSPSQQRAIKQIRDYFSRWGRYNYNDKEPKPLHRFEVETTEYGGAWVRVDTTDSVFTNDGGSFHIGPRGKVEVWSVHTLSDKMRTAKHYAKIFKGHVKKEYL